MRVAAEIDKGFIRENRTASKEVESPKGSCYLAGNESKEEAVPVTDSVLVTYKEPKLTSTDSEFFDLNF